MSSKAFNLILRNRINSFDRIINVDYDKSMSIRSFLLSAISENISSVSNILESDDVRSAINCLKKLGVKIIKKKSKSYIVFGKGLGSLTIRKNKVLDFGNSGTLARLLIGILSTTPNIDVKITGDHSLKKRSMKNLIELMSDFGAIFLPEKKFRLPLRIISSEIPIGIKYEAGVSAQLKSAVILAGLNSYGVTKIIESKKSRNHTENILSQNKKSIKIKKAKKNLIKVYGKNPLNPIRMNIPGDPSSAAFFTALTLLNINSKLKIKNVGINQTRTGFYKLLKKQGAKIKFENIKKENSEVRGDILIRSCKLSPLKASKNYYVNSTDEYPILFVIAALTKGVSIFKGIGDLANKESNRILEMQKVLKQVGVKCIAKKNEIKIFGKGKIDGTNKKINVPNLGDHRICMSAFILAVLTGTRAVIKNFETVYTSSPSFLKIMKSLGVKFELQN